jgi:hypothetical protein
MEPFSSLFLPEAKYLNHESVVLIVIMQERLILVTVKR